VNLQASFRLGGHAQLFARLANLLDRNDATAGFLTSNTFTAAGAFIANPANWSNEDFISPAQPLAIWTGARIRWE